jgi:hypothetical protein
MLFAHCKHLHSQFCNGRGKNGNERVANRKWVKGRSPTLRVAVVLSPRAGSTRAYPSMSNERCSRSRSGDRARPLVKQAVAEMLGVLARGGERQLSSS